MAGIEIHTALVEMRNNFGGKYKERIAIVCRDKDKDFVMSYLKRNHDYYLKILKEGNNKEIITQHSAEDGISITVYRGLKYFKQAVNRYEERLKKDRYLLKRGWTEMVSSLKKTYKQLKKEILTDISKINIEAEKEIQKL